LNTETTGENVASLKAMKGHFDVVIIGAGISGIGCARQLKESCPDKSFAILESKPSFGGTWHTHHYPGVRSDSDLYTFGYKSKPWTGNPVAQGSEILNYLGEAIDEDELDSHIVYERKVISASWDSTCQHWMLTISCLDDGSETQYSCGFLWMCQGYYEHEKGYTPDWPGLTDYKGIVVHPQNWPQDLDYAGKRVVVIGSGATAATLVPNIADDCAHVTMLQRSPTYFWTKENKNEMADSLRALGVDEKWIHEIVRRNLLAEQKEIFDLAADKPVALAKELLDAIRSYVGDDFDVEKHFVPRYKPGQQRLAYIPDGDLFKKIAENKITMVTDNIEKFTESGIQTVSGEHIEADIVVTATGFHMNQTGNIAITVDGEPVDFSQCYTYRGVMMSGLPNMASAFGYLRTSWTMRVELIAELVCRLLNYMDDKNYASCTPALRPGEERMERRLWIENDNFNAGYMQRGIDLFPKQGDREPWVFISDYYREKEIFPGLDFEDGVLSFVSDGARNQQSA
jgi:cation diffusion facilitator CzcD-associated flavoprotein CzcO